ncbi:oxidoreductase, partial [bacterium]|nr:oxidoreductase [bacterium]
RIYRPHEIRADPTKCLLDQGIICLGPVTRSGCGAKCLKANMPCRGCMGPTQEVADQGAGYVSMITSILGLEQEQFMSELDTRQLIHQIKDPVGTFYRFTLPKSFIRKRV